MIRGIGVDIIEIDRLRKAADEGGERFLERIFTEGEIAYCSTKHRRWQHLAARFAAKEAVSKALSTGWTGAFRWRDVEVANDASGQPRIILHGELQSLLAAATIHLSISHSDTHVVSMVVIEDAS